jgi:perosamine synthetase
VTRHTDIDRNLLPTTASLRDVMARLNDGVGGVVLFVDGRGVLKGVATDGDLRRAILAGKELDTTAENFMSRQFTAGRFDAEPTANLALLNDKIRHLPILDADGKPVDLLSWADMWRLPLVQPSFGGNEAKYVSDCVATGWISSQGPYIDKFQSAFADYMGGGHALSTSSGTTALHLALTALGIGPGDEVIVPDLTFGATANVVIHAGATPVFVDIDPITWCIDTKAIAAAITPRTKAIIPVHLYGHPCDMDPIMDMARAKGIKVIEDCAEALGAEYKGRKVGLIGDVGAFSFFANKVITTGEGGMVVTNDKNLHAKMAVLRDHGMAKDRRYWHLYPGFNYRMTNMQAAVGLAQMERINDFLKRRINLAAYYNAHLAGFESLQLPAQAPWALNIYWLYVIVVRPDRLGMDRDHLAAKLLESGIETRPAFFALHPQPAYANSIKYPCPVSEDIASRGLCLPIGNEMILADVDRVCEALVDVLRTQTAVRHKQLHPE